MILILVVVLVLVLLLVLGVIIGHFDIFILCLGLVGIAGFALLLWSIFCYVLVLVVVFLIRLFGELLKLRLELFLLGLGKILPCAGELFLNVDITVTVAFLLLALSFKNGSSILAVEVEGALRGLGGFADAICRGFFEVGAASLGLGF